MKQKDFFLYAVMSVFLGMQGCASSSDIKQNVGPSEFAHTKQTLQISGLKHCNNEGNDLIHLNPNEPLTIIVHGCFSSAGRFETLADVYGLYDQQAICFEYDDRKSLEDTSGELVAALNQLSTQNPNQDLHVIGHSQGGLVARRALTSEREDQQMVTAKKVQLTTVSSPFNGIEISSHCGITPLRILSLGIVDLICYAVTGEKYQQIPPNADFIEQPGELVASVLQHLIVKTDERNSCRKENDKGECIEDDYVFSVNEQSNNQVDDGVNTDLVTVKAGHVEIVGNGESVPTDLINILKQQKVLVDKSDINQQEQARLLQLLYSTPQESNL
ncbi:hydrolase [Aliivibrio fischeri]|uniref:esterase/lipase family protein n=1 Tax=Aliivibrio fischeri TaxID=668 RepID=UPI00080E651C|nr:alpha/beta hydrolase [Aliivibrio fischeri]OCH60141.1 hydrolase [Aliivibrio fischeri]